MRKWTVALCVLAVAAAFVPAQAADSADAGRDTYLGRWAFDIPEVGGPVWVGIRQEDGYLDADMLWVGGSVVPVASVSTSEENYMVTKIDSVVRERDEKGQPTRVHHLTTALWFDQTGNYVSGGVYAPNRNGKGVRMIEINGRRIPELPEAPDLSEAKYGEPVELFNGENLDGWKLVNPNHTNGWVVEDGVLYNRPKQVEGQPHISYGNLQTVGEFEDFNLTMDVNVPKDGNSGVYLRGIYEVQVLDSYGKPLDSHHMGAIYSRITPSKSAEKPAGEWQSLDITLCDRHVTVILNGETIIDNHPVLGCTGGALTANEFEPGPIYLQGDHDYVAYKNIVLKPIVKE